MEVFGIDVQTLLVQVFVLLISLSVHESAHAWSADRLGDPTARFLGRVSLNPLVHVDLVGTVLFPLLGLIAGGVVFGWAKPVPVNPRNLRRPREQHALIAAAGPFSNLILAAVCLIGFKLCVVLDLSTSGVLAQVLYFGLLLNVILAVFNLFPIPPLDGGWIAAGLLPRSVAGAMDWVRPYGFVLLFLLLYSGVFWTVLQPVLAFARRMAL